ncbi:MerR family DNA-binding transcriptional regulator [Sediminispirochaeta bajacaliforniensis]
MFNISISALRYYDKEGLFPVTQRLLSGGICFLIRRSPLRLISLR